MDRDGHVPVVLSVIIPCFNAGARLEEQLAALTRQRCPFEWEILLVDNGCTDDTMARAARWRDRLPLRILDGAGQRGTAHATNVGIRAARGDYLGFCDQDDVVADDWAPALVAALREHPFVGCRLELRTLNTAAAAAARRLNLDKGLEPTFENCPPAAGSCGMGVRRSVIDRIGPFDPRMEGWEDIELCWRIQLSGVPLAFAGNAVVHYRLRSRLDDLARQTARYGRAARLLVRWYAAHGLVSTPAARERPSRVLRRIVRIAARLPRVVWRADTLTPWVADLAFQIGWYRGGRLMVPPDRPKVSSLA